MVCLLMVTSDVTIGVTSAVTVGVTSPVTVTSGVMVTSKVTNASFSFRPPSFRNNFFSRGTYIHTYRSPSEGGVYSTASSGSLPDPSYRFLFTLISRPVSFVVCSILLSFGVVNSAIFSHDAIESR